MSQALSPSPGKRYGLVRICRVWQVARSTLYWQRQTSGVASQRPGPQGPGPDDERVQHIRTAWQSSPCHGAGYRQVWARLRYGGIRTSPGRVWRLRREPDLWAPTPQGNPHGPRAPDGAIIPERIDTMWGTDRTTTFTRHDGQVAICSAVDHCSAEGVGIHAAKHGTRFEALEPIRQGGGA